MFTHRTSSCSSSFLSGLFRSGIVNVVFIPNSLFLLL